MSYLLSQPPHFGLGGYCFLWTICLSLFLLGLHLHRGYKKPEIRQKRKTCKMGNSGAKSNSIIIVIEATGVLNSSCYFNLVCFFMILFILKVFSYFLCIWIGRAAFGKDHKLIAWINVQVYKYESTWSYIYYNITMNIFNTFSKLALSFALVS